LPVAAPPVRLGALTRFPPALVVAATLLLAAGGAAPAAAAAPQILGQTALAGTTGSCGHCSVVQFRSSSSAYPYVVPSSGVLTKVQVRVGTQVDAFDWVQTRTFRTSGTPDATVISQGMQHSLAGLAAGPRTFFDRVPATAGDVLGGRFHVLSNHPDVTPAQFATTSTDDVAGISFSPPDPDPGIGDLFSAETPVPSQYRVNMLAVLESDADGDGYGDTSQDLCPATSAAATTACSGTLFGSRLQGPPTGGGNCGYNCLRVQKTVRGASTAAAVDGVVVRWRLQAATAGSYRVRVVAPAGGATYTVLRSSAAETVTADPSPLKQAISTFPTRLPIPAGGYVGLVPPPFTVQRGIVPAVDAMYAQLNDVTDGLVTSGAGSIPGELFYDADIEPDADHDGYGDVTQDTCPSAAATQGACPPSPPPPLPVATTPPVEDKPQPAATIPVISGLKAVYTRFRVKARGAVMARAHAGTTLRLRLSEPAAVAFTVAKGVRCGRRRCARWASVHRFARDLTAGGSSLPYTGRYRRRGKARGLEPGRYRVTAVATNAAGRSSGAKRIRLTVVS
jgi:hypothetical protein